MTDPRQLNTVEGWERWYGNSGIGERVNGLGNVLYNTARGSSPSLNGNSPEWTIAAAQIVAAEIIAEAIEAATGKERNDE